MLSPAMITLELSNHEALVLFEYLCRCDDEGSYSFVDQAEEKVIWRVEGKLEKQLLEILSPDYHAFVAEARNQVRDPLD